MISFATLQSTICSAPVRSRSPFSSAAFLPVAAVPERLWTGPKPTAGRVCVLRHPRRNTSQDECVELVGVLAGTLQLCSLPGLVPSRIDQRQANTASSTSWP